MARLTTTNKLDVGMILDKDVVDLRTGAILIPENTAITKPFIKKLYDNRIHFVYIKDEEIPDGLRNEAMSKEYEKVERNLLNIFKDIKEGKALDTNKVAVEIKNFAKEIVGERDILTQMRLLKKKDDYTFNHSLGVSVLAITLGKWLEYSAKQILDLSVVGLFHDIGKLKISDSIVLKPGQLDDDEAKEMMMHSTYSYEMLLETGNFSDDILRGVLEHHEKFNGTGYPKGLKGEEIHEYARVISICDIYHAITSNRVYRDKDSPLRAADYLKQESFTTLDPNMTQVFLKNISRFYVGNKVLLSDGTTGIIVYIHPQDETKPIVQIGDKFMDFLQPQDLEILDIII